MNIVTRGERKYRYPAILPVLPLSHHVTGCCLVVVVVVVELGRLAAVSHQYLLVYPSPLPAYISPPLPTEPVPNYIQGCVDTVSRLHSSESPGDVLVFLTGQDEVDDVVRKLQAAPPQPGKGRSMSCVLGGGGVCMYQWEGVRE